MKVLYATYRYTPTNPDLGSSRDYECYRAFVNSGFSVKVVGPVTTSVNFLERCEALFWRIYKRITGKSGLKFPLTTAFKASRMLSKSVENGDYDIAFSAYHGFFVFGRLPIPSFWFFDTTFHGQEEDWPLYGKLALKITYWQEKQAFAHADGFATNSAWSKSQLKDFYQLKDKEVTVFPMPSALPPEIAKYLDPADLRKELSSPIRLLVVGRVFQRKGIDIAIDIARLLNAQGVPAVMKICGLPESDQVFEEHIEFVGPYKKSDPDQLKKYIDLYRWAHLLIHPARFEAAGIVPAEAAAFGTPTITNAVGGLATSVQDGVSGIVLPKGSPPEAYAQVIKDLLEDPARYHALCQTTRQRYEQELNWEVAGRKLSTALESAIQSRQSAKQKRNS